MKSYSDCLEFQKNITFHTPVPRIFPPEEVIVNEANCKCDTFVMIYCTMQTKFFFSRKYTQKLLSQNIKETVINYSHSFSLIYIRVLKN